MINVSGTTCTYATSGELIPVDERNTQGFSYGSLATLSSTTALIHYYHAAFPAADYFRVVTVDASDNVTESARTAATDDGSDWGNISVYSPTKAQFCYVDDSAGQTLVGAVLTIGTTVTVETPVTIDAVRTWDTVLMDPLSGNALKSVVLGDASSNVYGFVLTLAGSSFTAGAEQGSFYASYAGSDMVSHVNTSRLTHGGRTGALFYRVAEIDIDASANTLSFTALNYGDVSMNWTTPEAIVMRKFHNDHVIVATFDGDMDGTVFGTTTVSVSITHIWKTTDGAATWTNIGDPNWGHNVIGAVVVEPGTNYQTIYAAVSVALYKTTDGGTTWILETSVGYTVDFLALEKDNTTLFMSNRASGGNRASLWDGSTLTHIDTGKTTTGGNTAGDSVV